MQYSVLISHMLHMDLAEPRDTRPEWSLLHPSTTSNHQSMSDVPCTILLADNGLINWYYRHTYVFIDDHTLRPRRNILLTWGLSFLNNRQPHQVEIIRRPE